MKPTEYTFKIDALTPETLPLKRLTEYLREIAALFGETEHVHFDRVSEGSARLIQYVDPVAVPKVRSRLAAAAMPDAPAEVVRAVKGLDRLLANDNAVGVLLEKGRRAPVLRFEGRRALVQSIGPVFVDNDQIVGMVVSVGGRDATSHVQLQDGTQVHSAETGRDLACAIAQHLYRVVRLHGRARYQRDAAGDWTRTNFAAVSFDPLEDVPLREVLARLRPIADAWSNDNVRRLRRG